MPPIQLAPLWEVLRQHGIDPMGETCQIAMKHYEGRRGPTTMVTASVRHGRTVTLVIYEDGTWRKDEV